MHTFYLQNTIVQNEVDKIQCLFLFEKETHVDNHIIGLIL